MKALNESQAVLSDLKITVRRYVFSFNEKYLVISSNKTFKGQKPMVAIDCQFTDEPISTHKSPCIGDVVCDIDGAVLEIIATHNV